MVIVLHAAVLQGRLVLWAERSLAPHVTLRVHKRGRHNLSRGVKPHSYAGDAKDLARALWAVGLDFELPKQKGPTVQAVLPSIASVPWPSSHLIADPPLTRRRPILQVFTVPVLHLAMDAAVELLCHCAARPVLAPSLVVGRDLAFWARALRFVAGLVIRQRFLPACDAERSVALWEPALGAQDLEALNSLLEAMPASARSLTFDARKPLCTKREAFDAFAQSLIDHFVREATRHHVMNDLAGMQRNRFASLHDQWLYGLQASEPQLRAPEEELKQLEQQIAVWRTPLDVTEKSAFLLHFVLEEPAEKSEVWYVHYLVQAVEDPSLRVPLQLMWQTNSAEFQALLRCGADPRPCVLAALGQAARVSPEGEASLRAPDPTGFALDAAGAFAFLTETAPLLDEFGFGVSLPSWWGHRGAEQGLSVRAVVRGNVPLKGNLTLNKLIDFEWQVAFDGEALTQEELEKLARMKVPLVRVRGQWIQIGQNDLKTALAVWKARETTTVTLRELMHISLGMTPKGLGLPVDGVVATGWIAEIIERLDGRRSIEEVEVTSDFCGKLRPYQQRGLSWLAWLTGLGLGACLADDMGLGKTIQTLALIDKNRAMGEKRPVLLVCPTSVVGNWLREAERFTPKVVVRLHYGTARAKGDALNEDLAGCHLVVSSYGVLVRDQQMLEGIDWAGIVLDEAQNIKNPDTLQAKAARALHGDYRIALTGTPVENHVGDLWSIMEFLNPGLLDTRASFRTRFLLPIQMSKDPEVADRLHRMTKPFVLRRLKTDRDIIDDLPEKNEMKVFCGLSREQASLYKAVVQDAEQALDASEGVKRKGVILATLTKLKQICNHPAQFMEDEHLEPERSGKLTRLLEMLEEILAVGEKAIIFTQYSRMGMILRDELQENLGCEVPFLHGGVNRKRREALVDRFQSPDGPPLFVLSLKAGGTGLNLTAATHVFHFDRWWNPAVESQATDRAFRIGQKQSVQVHKMICAGTIEDTIDQMIDQKRSIAENIVGAGESFLTELPNEALKEIFALRTSAMGG